MIDVNLRFYDARLVKPPKSMQVLACVGLEYGGYFSTIPYSARYDAYNTHDHADNPEDTAIKVDYWCELPELPGKEEEN